MTVRLTGRMPLCLLAIFCSTLIYLSPGNTRAQQSINDYSVLPENLTGNITNNPNILILLDNSSSMTSFFVDANRNNEYVVDPETQVGYLPQSGGQPLLYSDPSSSFSNSFQVRKAISNVLNSPAFTGRLNVGLMSFGQNLCTYNPALNLPRVRRNFLVTSCLDNDGNLINQRGNPATNGLGLLKANIDELDGAHLDRLNQLLAPEPSPWDVSNMGIDDTGAPLIDFSNAELPVNGISHPFLSRGRIDGSENAIISQPRSNFGNRTPLAGIFESAFRYLYRNDEAAQSRADIHLRGGLNPREIALGTRSNISRSGIEQTTAININYLSQTQCEGPLTVILLTDGLPSQLPPDDLEDGIGESRFNTFPASVRAAIDAATTIRNRGSLLPDTSVSDEDLARVYVVGFNLFNQRAANQIAAAGGTGEAIFTTSTEQVEAAFSRIFNEVLEQGATRSGLSIIATPDSATGSFIQPSFTPLTFSSVSSDEAQQVVWTGELRNFFIDRFGNFREDSIPTGSSQGNDVLDADDKGFRILFDNDTNLTFVERFDVADDGEISNLIGTPDGDGGFTGGLISVEDLQSIWTASDQLDRLADDLAQVAANRPYTTAISAANNGRYIFTWLDNNSDGRFSTGEVNNFTWSNNSSAANNITPNNSGIFDLANTSGSSEAARTANADAQGLVNFIRGFQAVSANPYRNRVIDNKKLLLGDIVHSTPVQVDGPIPLDFSTNPLSTDALRDSYEPFAEHYANRRKMVYVGANDGMLHAFNGGFWTIDEDTGTITVDRQLSGETEHELGDEIWAFIPNAVLPHLKFLRDPNYAADQHIAFVDGSLEAFDVKIFDGERGSCTIEARAAVPNSCRYINGWGTILVGGLRYGGAEYIADFDRDGQIEPNEVTRSSYFIIDITDPEQPPVLLDELSAPELALTVGRPALVRADGNSATDREYHLIFGSGPNDLNTATNTSGVPASLFVYDLKSRNGLVRYPLNQSSTTAFVGDLTSVDWNLDDIDDAIYFGTVAGTNQNPDGQLFRATLTTTGNNELFDANVIFDVGRPIQHRPVVPADHTTQNDKYVLFGTGRTISLEDLNFNFSAVNRLYGIKELFEGSILNNPIQYGSPVVQNNQVLNTTSADLSATSEEDIIIDGKTRAEVLAAFADETTEPIYRGWFFDLPEPTSRLSARPVTLEELAFFTDFQPQNPATLGDAQCVPDGGSFLNVLDYRTGLFPSEQRLEVGASANTRDTTTNFVNFQVSSSLLGAGDILVIGEDLEGNTKFKFLAPGSNQEITDFDALLKGTTREIRPIKSGRKSWREIDLDGINTGN